MKSFGKRLNELRKAKGYTAQMMADACNVTLRTYRNYESGRSDPDLETVITMADLLYVSADLLLARDWFLAKPADERENDPRVHPKG